jgi:hypothetical protein
MVFFKNREPTVNNLKLSGENWTCIAPRVLFHMAHCTLRFHGTSRFENVYDPLSFLPMPATEQRPDPFTPLTIYLRNVHRHLQQR